MTAFADDIATATEMIAESGCDAVWQVQNEQVNALQPWKTAGAGSPPTFNVKIVLLPEGASFTEALQNLMAGTSVAEGSEQGLMTGAVPFVPQINDSVLIAGQTRMVKGIDILRPDGTPILYTLTFA